MSDRCQIPEADSAGLGKDSSNRCTSLGLPSLNLGSKCIVTVIEHGAASGVSKPARIYDLRATFASNALAANVTVFELARVMGTSVRMIERHYGALIDGAHAGITTRLDRLERTLEADAKRKRESGT